MRACILLALVSCVERANYVPEVVYLVEARVPADDAAAGDADAGDPGPGDSVVGDTEPGDTGPARTCASLLACQQNEVGGSGAPIDSGITAPFVLFQASYESAVINRDGEATPQPDGANWPYTFGAHVDPNAGDALRFFINDRRNHRVLIYDSIPTNGDALPSVVVGQADFTSGLVNGGAPAVNDAGINEGTHVSVCGTGQMFISDRNNHRVLGYNRVPTTSGAAADFVIGQPDFVTRVPRGGADGLNTPYGAFCVEDRLLVMDMGNHRILVFHPIPTSTMPSAVNVIGQADMQGTAGGCSADRLESPYEATWHGGELYVGDGANHRVLVFDGIPAVDGAVATRVVGQPDFDSCQINRGGTPVANSLAWASGFAFQGDVVAVNDHGNNRVLFFQLPLGNDPSAFAVLGQPDFTSGAAASPPTEDSFRGNKGLLFDGDYLWVADTNNHRVVVARLPY